MKNKRRFKGLFLYQRFQKKLISFVLVVNIMTIFLFYFSSQYFFQVFIDKGLSLGIPEGHVFYRFIGNLQGDMNIIFAITSILSIILILIGGYYISHKVSGPLYRLREELKVMNRQGEIKPIRFRRGDYILDIEKEFNELSDKLNEKINKNA